ncbi:uncharacterized protein GGS25DRAFT_343925 [Hypoxylon fragiforme]|uniref:uncharacterized protein n=1 Tax=Hypoxylon fragiforme TaxID=63214 RepID=UPI0020C5F75D|nr:uncharacterized protein GGS25DRAFT_343925 [Hypoxylon fragiforme]KAI2607623.1 hypothetical protein GGS25DRAFT_343925 [Hypoxylon fragiforme]
MRPSQAQLGLLPLLFTLVAAHPYPRDDGQDNGFGYLMPRACASYCGADNQFCCSSGEACTTSAGVASCVASAGGDVNFFTTTWTETKTYTSTFSSLLSATTPASGGTNGEPCVPPAGSGQIACGTICCANWQYCAHEGQCMPNAGAGSWTQWTTVGVVTTQYSAPYRVTSGSTIVQTSAPTTTTGTAASETTTSTAAPAPVASTSGSLSGGAIAGIVVGTIAGVALLLLLCFCCIVRGLWDAFAGIFGSGRRNRDAERVEIIEERYSRRGSRHGSAYGASAAAAARPSHRTWFGGGGGRPTSAASRNEKHSSSGGAGWLAATLGGAALLLGLRRDERRRAASRRPVRTDIGSSHISDYSSSTNNSPSRFITRK